MSALPNLKLAFPSFGCLEDRISFAGFILIIARIGPTCCTGTRPSFDLTLRFLSVIMNTPAESSELIEKFLDETA